MARYVVINIPAYGHVNPTLAVVRELVQRGNEVVYYLTEEFRAAVEEVGATFRPYQSFMSRPASPGGPLNMAGGKPGMAALAKAHAGQESIAQMLERVRADQPDYIFYDPLHLWARTIAQALRVPGILSRPMFVANEHFNPLKGHLNLADKNGRNTLVMPIPPQVMEHIQAEINEVRRQYDLPPFDMSSFYMYDEPLHIVYIARAFHPASDTFDERFVFVGPSLLHRRDASTDPQREPGLYISLGTIFNKRPEFFTLCFDAFGGLPWQVVMARGPHIDERAVGSAPEGFQIAAYVQQHEVLPRTSVFITHGGMGSVMESLYYGVPMVVIPPGVEQEATARRVAELGLGIALEQKDLTAEALRAAVERVHSTPAFYERARAMQQHVREAGGAQKAADALQSFARWHSSTTQL